MSHSHPKRKGSPLATHGPRTSVHVSKTAAATADQVATEFGLTQRIVLDATLEDAVLLRRVATRASARVRKARKPVRSPKQPRSAGDRRR